MGNYSVSVIVENRPTVRDPEGETILRDLLAKNNYDCVKSVRTAKLMKLVIEAQDEEQARQLTKQMCDELRIYNPVVSSCSISVMGSV